MSRISRVLPSLVLLFGTRAFAATDVASSAAYVTIRPAVSAHIQGAELDLKIRLAPEAQALVWKSNSCELPSSSAYTVAQSGSYRIALTELTGDGAQVCVRSTDGALSVVAR